MGTETLSDRLRRGQMPLDQAIAIARRIAETLVTAHAVSRIHGTLAPSKIELAGDQVKLLDFDAAKLSLVTAERSDDVFALGRILFEMLCGRRPVEGELPRSLRPELPALVDVVIGAMLAKQPASRPSMVDVVQLLSSMSAAPPPPPAVPELGDDVPALCAALEACTAAKEWTQALALIGKLAELERDSTRKGAYYHSAALIARDELQDLDAAVEYCNYALDASFANADSISQEMLPRALAPFKAIERMLTRTGDWKSLERNHRKMIVRVRGGSNHELQVTLWDALGEIYRSHLQHYTSALAAFEMAQQLDPESATRTDGVDRAAIIAELRQLTNQPA